MLGNEIDMLVETPHKFRDLLRCMSPVMAPFQPRRLSAFVSAIGGLSAAPAVANGRADVVGVKIAADQPATPLRVLHAAIHVEPL